MTYNIAIDADSILYTACYRNQVQIDDKVDLDLEMAYMDFCSKIARIKSTVWNKHKEEHIDRYYHGKPIYKGLNIVFNLYMSPKHTFRHDLSELYKANRKPTDIVGIGDLKQLVYERLGYTEIPLMEADDLVITQAYEVENTYIACIDKDIYKHSPVDCINYNTWEWTSGLDETKIEENYIHQAIWGDSTDNIKGAKGKGEKFADSFTNNMIDEWTYETWQELYTNSEEAELNMRLVRLDQFKNGELELWDISSTET